MDKLQRVEVTLQESQGWLRKIFNQIFRFIGLMESTAILIRGNQMALKFDEITNSKVVSPSLWQACWSEFSQDMEAFSPNLSSKRERGFEFSPDYCKEACSEIRSFFDFPTSREKSGLMVGNPKRNSSTTTKDNHPCVQMVWVWKHLVYGNFANTTSPRSQGKY